MAHLPYLSLYPLLILKKAWWKQINTNKGKNHILGSLRKLLIQTKRDISEIIYSRQGEIKNWSRYSADVQCQNLIQCQRHLTRQGFHIIHESLWFYAVQAFLKETLLHETPAMVTYSHMTAPTYRRVVGWSIGCQREDRTMHWNKQDRDYFTQSNQILKKRY